MPEYRISQDEQLKFLNRLEKNKEDELLPQYFRARLTGAGFDHSRPIQSLQDGTDTVYYQ